MKFLLWAIEYDVASCPKGLQDWSYLPGSGVSSYYSHLCLEDFYTDYFGFTIFVPGGLTLRYSKLLLTSYLPGLGLYSGLCAYYGSGEKFNLYLVS